ncbi:MAG: amidohydrolase [Bacteroidales bacterium]|jgi:amidohydrolase|nr:amidohydrolase [Bacteroidales bacterium]
MKRIKDLAKKHFPYALEDRHYLHQHPELSGKEQNTAHYIVQTLNELHIPYKKDVAGYGIVALLNGDLAGNHCVALRADMDALPIQEISNKEYCSQVSGVMHACGHDVHVACLLGVLRMLNEIKHTFGGTIKAIFQPSEEVYDGGAPFMIDAGVLENPKVELIFAQHVTHGMECGKIGLCEGAFMASTDEIHIHIHGKGGHAALENEVINPILMGMELISQLTNYHTLNRSSPHNSVLAFGKFIAAGETNIIPNSAVIAGTLRTFNEKWRATMLITIKQIATMIEEKFGGEIAISIKNGYPVLVNEPTTTHRVKQYATDFLGVENVLEIPPRMTAEDFAYFLQQKPGTFIRLGVSNIAKNITATTHSNTFDIDESAIETGMGLMSYIALKELGLLQNVN